MSKLKITEQRVRRQAAKLDLQLVKSRRRNQLSPDFGAFWLMDPYRNTLVMGGEWGCSLQEIENYLTSNSK
jgi:hypothetical protein